MSPTEFDGAVAIVTGGASGLGAATAALLAERGARVAVLDRDPNPAHFSVPCDVTDDATVRHAVEAVVVQFGELDIVINNAGVGVFRPVADMAVDEWHRIIDTNLSGVFYCCHAALPHLKKRGGGWIINISSLASKNAFVNGAAYCASKSALNAFSEALMQEVRYDGVRVAYVLPGSVNTAFGGLSNTKSDWALMPDDVAEVIVDLIAHPTRSLPSRVEIRPAQPPRKS